MLKIVNTTLNVIIYAIIFNQILILTKFIYNYNFHYDYGNTIGNICNKERVEYETGRYQLTKNIENIRHDNVNDNILLAISIIFTITISLIFTIIVYRQFCNLSDSFINYNIISKIYIIIMLFLCACVLIYPILLIIFKLFEFGHDISFYNHEIKTKNILIFVFILVALIILKIATIELKYKLPEFVEYDIDKNKKLLQLGYFIFYAFIYICMLYYITNVIILYNYKKNNIKIEDTELPNNKNVTKLFINKIFGISEHNKYINKIEYKKTIDLKIHDTDLPDSSLPENLNNFNIIPIDRIDKIKTDINKLLTQELVYNIDELIISLIRLYIENKYKESILVNQENNDQHKNTLNALILDNDNIKTLAYKDNIASIISEKIIIDIDALANDIIINNVKKLNIENKNIEKEKTEIYISDKKSIFRRNIEGLLFIIGIFIVILIIINLFIKYFKKELSNKIKNTVIVPLICLYVIILILVSNNTFIKLVNNYIIENPKKSYKTSINNTGLDFNKILENEFYIYENSNNALCMNLRYAIVSVVINVIFNNSIILNNELDTENRIIDTFPASEKPATIPSDCNNNVDNIDYNFKTYLDTVFYETDDCSDIKYDKIKLLIKNTILFNLNSSKLNIFLKDIKYENYSNNTNIDDVILYNIIYKKQEYEDIKVLIKTLKENLKNVFDRVLYNVLIAKKSYDNKDAIADINYLTPTVIKEYITNNTNNEIVNKYNYIVSNVIDEYISLIIKNHYLLSRLYDNKNFKDIVENLETKCEDFKFKKQVIVYVNNFIKLYEDYLHNLDLIFKNKYNLSKKTNRLSLYLINIYNNLNYDNPYISDIIYPYGNKNENDINNKNILTNLVDKIHELISDYDKLKIICHNNMINGECDITSSSYSDDALKSNISNVIDVSKINIMNILELIEVLKTDKNLEEIFNSYYVNSNIKRAEITNITNLFDYLKDSIDDLKDNYDAIDINTNIETIKTVVKTKFYEKDTNGMIIYNEIKYYIKIINNIIKLITNKKYIKNIEKKEAVLEINSRIKEVNISFVYLLIIYLIIILLIKYIK
jgi:hypothetical protein